jgi:hypothetical protein
MIEQLGDVEHEPVEGQRGVGRWHLRAAMAAQIEPHDAIIPGQMRDPGEIAQCAAHRGMQQ